MTPIPIAIHGAAGRMGQRLVALATEDAELRVAGAVDRAGCPELGRDAGTLAGVKPLGVNVADKLDGTAKVVIDFTTPAATRVVLEACVKNGAALVIGTTCLTPDDHKFIDAAAKKIAVLQAPNMSLGVNLLFALAAQVAKQLGDDYDIEIVESHHRFKKDAPSGTALGIAQAICDATGKDIVKDVVHGRHGDDTTRKRGEIGMHALRVGDVVGDHTVTFGAPGERLELSHYASTRDVFARGALRAAKWLAGKKPGRYQMKDVLGL
ncbi:MAG: 4-hydroxy-tetrahydrodipicolinate reductase [Planctomycetes bacterium]|nr:4-hydroxy-tetrahydrodipicolinate reductase [Planctomycetota bacterium]